MGAGGGSCRACSPLPGCQLPALAPGVGPCCSPLSHLLPVPKAATLPICGRWHVLSVPFGGKALHSCFSEFGLSLEVTSWVGGASPTSFLKA